MERYPYQPPHFGIINIRSSLLRYCLLKTSSKLSMSPNAGGSAIAAVPRPQISCSGRCTPSAVPSKSQPYHDHAHHFLGAVFDQYLSLDDCLFQGYWPPEDAREGFDACTIAAVCSFPDGTS